MENSKTLQANQLLFLGILMFFLGLVVGFFIPLMANPRMGLSSHLEGVMNGMFIVILGLVWNRLELSKKLLNATYWLTLYGTFANFITVLVAAITGGGKMMPLAKGQEKGPVLEAVISFLLISLSLAMLAVCVLAMIGLYKHMKHHLAN